MNGPILLGTGVLTWSGYERRSDRYGAVWLMKDGPNANSRSASVPGNALVGGAVRTVSGHKGRLLATVIEARKSTHIGDIFRGIGPVTPEVGEVIELGTGTAFYEGTEWGDVVGLRPDDGREDDWLDPRMLYRAHEQLVKLIFVPAEGGEA